MEETLFIVYVDEMEDVYIVKANSKKEAINIIYDEVIKPLCSYHKFWNFKKSDMRAEYLNDVIDNKKFVCLT